MIRLLMFMIFLIQCPQVHAQVKIKEIKEYLKTINPETTCLDEYLERRKQLIIKLTATPVIAGAGMLVPAYIGGVAGAAIGTAYNNTGWAAIGYAIGGVAIGAATGLVAVGVDTTFTAIQLGQVDQILRANAEQHLNRTGINSSKLYQNYLKKAQNPLEREEFDSQFQALDSKGTLCDGSLVKQPRFKIGFKLRYKVARIHHLIEELDQD